MFLPNYENRSIVNLMSSISKAFGHKSQYKPLRSLKPKELSKSKNVVLLLIDGLGYEYLLKHTKKSVLRKNLRDRITSVFPATTASAVTTFHTGLAPQEHGITGWFMHMKEIGLVIKPLPFTTRNGIPIDKCIDPRSVFDQTPIFNKLMAKSYVIIHKDLIDSGCTKAMCGIAKRLPYTTPQSLFKRVEDIIHLNRRRKYICAYEHEFDLLCHKYGTRHRKVHARFNILCKCIESLLQSIKGTDTILIITSDHGFTNVPKSRQIILERHPVLKEALTLPLCGESRAAYCYVHPSKAGAFEAYVKKNLKNVCWIYKSEQLFKKHCFGLHKPHPKFFDRIGDYVLVMKENYAMRDSVLGEKRHFHPGKHAGVSREEMFVPLVVMHS